ncbi:hypothetical protein [Parabacteroides sp. AM08-6]|uniref:crAss001_48 related protein n=1 Tax=Parabacteroides sp. AM08-6 TaxID=2292053 RepID=UPI000EFF172F|nr:hypothetical protein [Parabacteroides sp. AM08-6]RHJ76384.1 hypothetical protein DW103_16855 [Parabacteroides sp. AM08-6]
MNTKKYIGTKEINAIPMNRQEYNDFRGWELPADENGSDEGYLVEYVDGGKANTPQYAGYVSWSPKDVFERAYKSIETPLDRLYIERDELMDKYNKLVLFLGREDAESIAGEMQVELMELQKIQMHDYLLTLRTRIELMKK